MEEIKKLLESTVLDDVILGVRLITKDNVDSVFPTTDVKFMNSHVIKMGNLNCETKERYFIYTDFCYIIDNSHIFLFKEEAAPIYIYKDSVILNFR